MAQRDVGQRQKKKSPKKAGKREKSRTKERTMDSHRLKELFPARTVQIDQLVVLLEQVLFFVKICLLFKRG